MKRFAFLPLFALLALNACDDDDDPVGNEDIALVRIVNASTANASINVVEGTTTHVTGVGFRTASACSNLIELEPGSHTLSFRSTAAAGTEIESETFTFAANETYTVVLYNTGANLDAVVFQDDEPGSATAGNNAVRIINATNTAGDIFVTTPAGAVTGNADVGNLAAGAGTTSNTFRLFPTGETQFRLFNVGTTTTARGDVTIDDLNNDRVTTVIFTEQIGGTGATGFQMDPC